MSCLIFLMVMMMMMMKMTVITMTKTKTKTKEMTMTQMLREETEGNLRCASLKHRSLKGEKSSSPQTLFVSIMVMMMMMMKMMDLLLF